MAAFHNRGPMSLIGSVVFVAVWLTISTTVGVLIGKGYERQKATALWPSVQGEVTAASVERRSRGTGEDRRQTYMPVVKYQYALDGKTYSSSTLAFLTGGFNTQERAVEFLDNAGLHAGKPVTVYYDPRRPSVAVLQKGVSPGSRNPKTLILGIGWGIGLVLLVISLRRWLSSI